MFIRNGSGNRTRLLLRDHDIIADDGSDWVHRLVDDLQIGFDDKAGVAMILLLAEPMSVPFKVLLTTGEEKGRTGVQYRDQKLSKLF